MTQSDKTGQCHAEPGGGFAPGKEQPVLKASRWRQRWFLLPVGLLGALLALQVAMIAIATTDPGFAVERDYYQKATHWDEAMKQKAASLRLGWKAEAGFERGDRGLELVVRLDDASGKPVDGAGVSAEVFHNARAAKLYELRLVETQLGQYRVALPSSRPGLWEVRLTALSDGGRFTHTARVDLAYAGETTP